MMVSILVSIALVAFVSFVVGIRVGARMGSDAAYKDAKELVESTIGATLKALAVK